MLKTTPKHLRALSIPLIAIPERKLFETNDGPRLYVNRKCCTKSCLFNARSSIIVLVQKDVISFLDFLTCLTFVFPFCVGSRSKYKSGTHSGSSSARQKSSGSCGFRFHTTARTKSSSTVFDVIFMMDIFEMENGWFPDENLLTGVTLE